MVVRKLSEHDFNALWTLRLQALIDNPEVFDASYEETVAYGNQWLLKRLRQGDETFYLGAFEETLIGMIGFRREEGIKTRHKGHILGLYVLPQRRGQGVGKALVQELLAQAKQLAGLEQLHFGDVTRPHPSLAVPIAKKLHSVLLEQLSGILLKEVRSVFV